MAARTSSAAIRPVSGVAVVAADPDLEVTAVGGAERLGEPELAQRHGPELGAAAAADRVDRGADQNQGHRR